MEAQKQSVVNTWCHDDGRRRVSQTFFHAIVFLSNVLFNQGMCLFLKLSLSAFIVSRAQVKGITLSRAAKKVVELVIYWFETALLSLSVLAALNSFFLPLT